MLLLGVLQAQAAGAGPVVATDFDLLEQRVLDSSAASVTFSSLSTYAADYQHLQLRFAARTDRALAVDVVSMQFNTDTGSNYSLHRLTGNGSTVSSGANASQSNFFVGFIAGGSGTASQFGAGVSDILDPFESTKNTTVRSLTGTTGPTNEIDLYSGAWYNTSSITEIKLFPAAGDNFVQYSRFSLYGVKGSA